MTLTEYVHSTMGRPLDYQNHDCLRWVLDWLHTQGATHWSPPYTDRRTAWHWVRAQGGYSKIGPLAAEHCGLVGCGMEPGAMAHVRLPEIGSTAAIVETDKRVVILSEGGIARVTIEPEGCWKCLKH